MVRYWQQDATGVVTMWSAIPTEFPEEWTEVTVSPVVPQGAATPADETARKAIRDDVEWTLRTVAAHYRMKGKWGESIEDSWIVGYIDRLTDRLAASPADADTAERIAQAWDEGCEAFEAAHRWDNTEPWQHLADNPYRATSV